MHPERYLEGTLSIQYYKHNNYYSFCRKMVKSTCLILHLTASTLRIKDTALQLWPSGTIW